MRNKTKNKVNISRKREENYRNCIGDQLNIPLRLGVKRQIDASIRSDNEIARSPSYNRSKTDWLKSQLKHHNHVEKALSKGTNLREICVDCWRNWRDIEQWQLQVPGKRRPLKKLLSVREGTTSDLCWDFIRNNGRRK